MDTSLLAIFAHPDDESIACGGLLAECAERGVRVSLLCLTHGEHGPGGTPEHLRVVRARELAEAARVLGVSDVTLLGHEDGMLPWIEPATLETDILAAIRRASPDVVVTFDEDGLYGHPDHVAVHQRVSAVVRGLGEVGPALRYVSMPVGAMRSLVDAAEGPRAHAPEVLGIHADAFGAVAPPATHVLRVPKQAQRKLRALR